jgi:hypothetical protein
MRRVLASLALLSSAALAGCEIMVNRYDSDSPAFTIEYDEDTEPDIEIAQEYCAVYGLSPELSQTELVYGDLVAVYDCL